MKFKPETEVNKALPHGDWLKHVEIEQLLSACGGEYWYQWRNDCELIPNYMPPFPRPSTAPIMVIRHGESFLRHSHGPRQGWFWDCYGDDMCNVGLAIIALMECPPPPKARPWHKAPLTPEDTRP